MPDLAVTILFVLDSDTAKANSGGDVWAKDYLKNSVARSGAFKVESWKPGVVTIYTRSDRWKSGYWPGSHIRPDEVGRAYCGLPLTTRRDFGLQSFELGVQRVQVLDAFGLQGAAENSAAAVELGAEHVGGGGGGFSGGEAGHVGVDGGLDGGGLGEDCESLVGALVGPAGGGGDFFRHGGGSWEA